MNIYKGEILAFTLVTIELIYIVLHGGTLEPVVIYLVTLTIPLLITSSRKP